MVTKFFLVEAALFLISLVLFNFIFKLFQKILSKTPYKVTTKFNYIISCLAMLILGIIVGKMIIGKLM